MGTPFCPKTLFIPILLPCCVLPLRTAGGPPRLRDTPPTVPTQGGLDGARQLSLCDVAEVAGVRLAPAHNNGPSWLHTSTEDDPFSYRSDSGSGVPEPLRIFERPISPPSSPEVCAGLRQLEADGPEQVVGDWWTSGWCGWWFFCLRSCDIP